LDYVFSSTQTALIWLIVISAICGWVIGIATSFLVRHRTRRRA
jgi:heme/copper-type cytochrome/quinol oxidase subunit 2